MDMPIAPPPPPPPQPPQPPPPPPPAAPPPPSLVPKPALQSHDKHCNPSRPSSGSHLRNGGSRAHPAQNAPRHPTKPSRKAANANNKLVRSTPFVATITFKNTLPELPGDPKLLTGSLNKSRLAQFRLTQMESALRPDLVGGLEQGHLSIIDAERFCVDPGTRGVDAEDRALTEGKQGGKSRSSVSWLMRTKYLEGRDSAPVQRPNGEAALTIAAPTLTVEMAKQRIAESFEAAQLPPKHPTNPALTAQQIMPILPNTDSWENCYVTATCMGQLISELERPKTSAEERDRIAGASVLKSYAYPQGAVEDPLAPKTFLALLAPQKVATGEDDDDGEGEYQWLREFTPQTLADADTRTYSILLSDTTAQYVPIRCNYNLGKRKRDDFTHVPIPRKVDVYARELTTEEGDARRQRMKDLYGLEDD